MDRLYRFDSVYRFDGVIICYNYREKIKDFPAEMNEVESMRTFTVSNQLSHFIVVDNPQVKSINFYGWLNQSH